SFVVLLVPVPSIILTLSLHDALPIFSNRYIARRDVVMIFRLRLKNIFFIFVGAAIFSFGIVHFNMQNNLSEGGFTGITLLFYFLWDWDPAIMNIVLNVPIF